MQQFKFKKIDAFATNHSAGNPAGMVKLGSFDEITVTSMQSIAKELAGFVSEVGYVCQVDKDTFELKFYSEEREVDFCGHATIAIMYDLVKSDEKLIQQKYLKIKTNKGTQIVENRVQEEDAVFITAPEPVFASVQVETTAVAAALGIEEKAIHTKHPVSIVNAGLETLIVPIQNLDSVLGFAPDYETLRSFCHKIGVDIVIVYTAEVVRKENSYRTRVFPPTFGYLEDPATGSGNSALGYYLLKNKQWDGSYISIEQNASREKPNIVKLKVRREQETSRVAFGGNAVVRIKGEYCLERDAV